MTMERQDHKKIHTIPPTIPSGGLNGEVMVASKTHLSFLLSRMKTDETAELSILTYLCGSGVIGNKCSVGENYYVMLYLILIVISLPVFFSCHIGCGCYRHNPLMTDTSTLPQG